MSTRKTLLALTSAMVPAFAALAQPAPAPKASLPEAQQAPAMEQAFRDPPNAARPRVWWHWMNGNITRDGIAKDIDWMARVGIGGLQNFDVDLSTAQIVDHRLAYMTAEWRDAFRFAAQQADAKGLELAIASSPGWSETGGPWVAPADGLKKLVWSEVEVSGGKNQRLHLPSPPSVAGPYQALPSQPDISDLITAQSPHVGPAYYQDVRVLAVPVAAQAPLPRPKLSDGAGRAVEGLCADPALGVCDISLTSVFGKEAPTLNLDYGRVITVRSLTLHIAGGAIPLLGPLLKPTVEASLDGQSWQKIMDVPLEEPPVTLSFPAVTARYFRVVVHPAMAGGAPEGDGKPNPLAMEDAFGKAIGGLLSKPVHIGQFQLHPGPMVDRFQVKAGFAIASDYFALPTVEDGVQGADAARVIDLTRQMRPDGTLDWTPPAGHWKIIRFGYSLLGKTNHPAPAEATGLEVDKYDGAAVARYLEHYLDTYQLAAGKDLMGERGLRALLTDSIEIGAANWTPRMIEQFQRLRGYDPVPWMPVLAGHVIGSREQSDKFLFDFRRTLSDLMASEHYGTVARIAHARGLKVYGESIEGNRSAFGDDMAMRRYADYPMGAMWAFDQAKGPAQSYVIDLKGAASVAHLYGRPIVAAESMTAGMAPWAFGPDDLKPIADLEFVLGVNRPVIHTSVHVPVEGKAPGLSLGGIGQFFNRNESWAELAQPWVSYLSRNAYLLQQGRNVADVAYFYGEEAPLAGLYGQKPAPYLPVAHAYDFINADALLGALHNEGGELVSEGGARYRVLYLGGSSQHMSLPVLRRLVELVEGGATVVGLPPVSPPGLNDDVGAFAALKARLWPAKGGARIGKGRVLASDDLAKALQDLAIAPDVRLEGEAGDAEIPFVHRRWSEGDSYFLVNRKDRAEKFTAHFRVSGKVPELWHAETGAIEPVSYRIIGGETLVPLELPARGAVHVVFRKLAPVDALTLPEPLVSKLLPVTTPWQVAFQTGRGAPASVTMAGLQPLNHHADPAIRYFSGEATYSTSFTLPKDWTKGSARNGRVQLDLGEARDVAEVRVNGQVAGYAWHAPYVVDIAPFVQAGKVNKLEVRVANLWVNRLIRDADPKVTDKVAWASVATYRPDAPLRPSGLIGPVSVKLISR